MFIVIFGMVFRMSALQKKGLYDVFNANFPTKRTPVAAGNDSKSLNILIYLLVLLTGHPYIQ